MIRQTRSRGLAVEAHRLQQRTQLAQPREVVGRRLADRRIETTLALARPEHIPQPEPMREQMAHFAAAD